MKVSNFQLFVTGTPGKSTGKYGIRFHFNKRQMSINENKSNYIICDKYQTLIAPSPQTLGTPTDTPRRAGGEAVMGTFAWVIAGRGSIMFLTFFASTGRESFFSQSISSLVP